MEIVLGEGRAPGTMFLACPTVCDLGQGTPLLTLALWYKDSS